MKKLLFSLAVLTTAQIGQAQPVFRPLDTNPDQFSQMIKSGVKERYVPFQLKQHPVLKNGRLVKRGVAPNAILEVPTEIPLRDASGRILRDGQGRIRYRTKKVKAGRYYAELNKFEGFLTKNGYSLRKNYKNNTIKKLVLKPAELKSFRLQSANTLRAHNNKPIAVQAHRRLVTNQRQVITNPNIRRTVIQDNRRNLGRIRVFKPIIIRPGFPKPPAPKPKTFGYNSSWSKSWGWSNKFAAYLNTSLRLNGSSQQTRVQAKGEGGGYIFGKKLRLIRGDALAQTPKQGRLKGHVYAYVLGFKIINLNVNQNAAHFLSRRRNKNFDESKSIRFTLGPIPMKARIGGQGRAALEYRTAFLPLKANADIGPEVSARGYIQVGVDIIVAGAGAGANLLILKDELDVVGRLSLGMANNKPAYKAKVSAYNQLTAIKGNMHAYVYIYVPRWGLPPWKKKTWRWNIFNFGGVSTKGTILSYSKTASLY